MMRPEQHAETTKPLDDVIDAERDARAKIHAWWHHAGAGDPSYPATTETAARLLCGVEYSADRDALLRAITERWFPSPRRGAGGKLEWLAVDIVTAARALEARRQWAPFSTLHAAKMTHWERQRQVQEHNGQEAFVDLGNYDVTALLALLVEFAAQPHIVQAIATAIAAKLDKDQTR